MEYSILPTYWTLERGWIMATNIQYENHNKRGEALCVEELVNYKRGLAKRS